MTNEKVTTKETRIAIRKLYKEISIKFNEVVKEMDKLLESIEKIEENVKP
jgi:hypothetical protein